MQSLYPWRPFSGSSGRVVAVVVLYRAVGFAADRSGLHRSYGGRATHPRRLDDSYLQFGSARPGILGLKGFSRGELLTGAHVFDLTGPRPDYKQVGSFDINANNQLVLVAGDRSFVLGSRAGMIPGDDKSIPAFAAEPGDTASITLERSLFGWPVAVLLGHDPIERAADDLVTPSLLSLILGQGLRLLGKASGARLDVVWRCEQGWELISGWHSFGFAELIQVEIRPAPPSQPAHR